jgi:hypothetical protein
MQAAVIAAIVALATWSMGELFSSWRGRRARKSSVRETYQKYVDPLTQSSVDLFWRLCEIFDTSGSGFYLKGSVHLTSFEHYKALSTLYRLANLLGWIRALRRELMFLKSHSRKAQESLDKALNKLGAALAEGGKVETRRVEALVQLWSLTDTSTPEGVKRAGVHIDAILKNCLHNRKVKNANEFAESDKLQLTRDVADELTQSLKRSKLSDELIKETIHRAADALTVRESWIYRDWQTAVGDTMLKSAPSAAARLFEVIGYREFEAVIHGGTDEDRLWLRRLHGVIDDVDVHGDRKLDARIEQLQAIHLANIEVLQALQITDRQKTRVSHTTRAKINDVLKELK